MRTKRGTHVGMVLSFVLFMTFLTFMFVLIRFPFSIEQKKEGSLDLIKENLVEILSNDVTTILISNSSANSGENCLGFSGTNLNLAGSIQIAKDGDTNTINSKREGENFYVGWENSESFFKIHYTTSGFNSYSDITCTNTMMATIVNIRQSREILESEINLKLEEYESNYGNLKTEIGVPTNNEFKFQFKYENKTIIGEEMEDIKKDIYLKNYPVDYLDLDGNTEMGNLLIYVW